MITTHIFYTLQRLQLDSIQQPILWVRIQGSVSVAVSLLSEILARDVIVSLQTINGMAVGESINNFACMLKGFVATFVMLTGVISPLN